MRIKKVLLVFSAILMLSTGFQSCKKTALKNNIINVSGLFSLTGNWSTLGINSEAALTLAVDDINTYLERNDAQFRLSASFYDTELDPDNALQNFVKATRTNTPFVIGPQSSAELAAIIPYTESAHMIVISQGSTAGSLAIEGDPVFRFCPTDKVEGAAIANTIYADDIKGLVTIARNDAGNIGLQSATGASFAAKGGAINAIEPYGIAVTDFASVITALKERVKLLAATYGITHTAIYLASFDEGAALMAQAANDSILSNIKWYGGDGVALSTAFVSNAAAGEFAVKTGFFAPSFGLPETKHSKWQPVANRIKAITGIDADAFALAAYDAMWVIAHTLEATHGNTTDFTQLKTVFVEQSSLYTGITGSTELDRYGDRSSGSFDYWGITKTATGYTWSIVGQAE